MQRSVGVVAPASRLDVERLVADVDAIADRLAPARTRIERDDPRSGVVAARHRAGLTDESRLHGAIDARRVDQSALAESDDSPES